MKRIAIRLITIIILAIFTGTAAAQAGKSGKAGAREEGYTGIKKSRTMVGFGGGYFMALGNAGTFLEPNYAYKLFIYNNNIGGSALGVGIEASYADLKDKDNNGGIRYTPTIFYITLTWPIMDILDIQAKPGIGVTTMVAQIDNGVTTKTDSSVDFTWSLGIAVFKILLKEYFVGLEYDYYHMFEKESTKAHSVNFFTGYKF